MDDQTVGQEGRKKEGRVDAFHLDSGACRKQQGPGRRSKGGCKRLPGTWGVARAWTVEPPPPSLRWPAGIRSTVPRPGRAPQRSKSLVAALARAGRRVGPPRDALSEAPRPAPLSQSRCRSSPALGRRHGPVLRRQLRILTARRCCRARCAPDLQGTLWAVRLRRTTRCSRQPLPVAQRAGRGRAGLSCQLLRGPTAPGSSARTLPAASSRSGHLRGRPAGLRAALGGCTGLTRRLGSPWRAGLAVDGQPRGPDEDGAATLLVLGAHRYGHPERA